jgi:hypothetical protein
MTNTTAAPLTITTAAGYVTAEAELPSIDDAIAYVIQFPTSPGLKCHYIAESGRNVVTARIKVAADGANGGQNETGLKRLAKIRAAAAKLGIEIIEK